MSEGQALFEANTVSPLGYPSMFLRSTVAGMIFKLSIMELNLALGLEVNLFSIKF